uniref:Predicted protein n=1 Tax=Hordeum vulgare subsp. vulgare TaxID=112509 RepID=F2E490_HORVV|nr:predicted protein [Hordeum vulgare subsp. vulgare]
MMWNTMFITTILFSMVLSRAVAQNVCTAAAMAVCGPYPCVQTDVVFSCLCPNMTLGAYAAACGNGITPTIAPPVIGTQCGLVTCPAGATCIPTNQNPAQYICVCPNNIIANPDCPTNPLPYNPCLVSNPCTNGGTCVVNQLTLQAVCICPPNTYGANCASYCRQTCDLSWCYNGGQCVNAYGQPYCSCPQYYRGRRCELRYTPYNYVYLYYAPQYYGK